MIEVVLMGGLGNALFQYAAGRALALKHGTRLQLNISRYLNGQDPRGQQAARALEFFDIKAVYTTVSEGRRRMLERLYLRERRQFFAETTWGFDPDFQGLGAKTTLFGYFQSADYWAGLDHVIRTELTPRCLPEERSFRDMLNTIHCANAVSVHVRRRDYLGKELHNVCTTAYFERAMHQMRERIEAPTFFVFSDDLGWCREQLGGPDTVLVDLFSASRDPALDMYLMSRCRHHIISNSTFSWWGAWLNDRPDKIVLVPDRWFNDETMNRLAMRDTVPAEWQRIPCGGESRQT